LSLLLLISMANHLLDGIKKASHAYVRLALL
jgi:hypothetical protein